MKAIRGATTVSTDSPNEIKESVYELLTEMKFRNELKAEDFICLMFSSTVDITSFYPAKAAREAGFYYCPLFSSLEPDIKGSLKLCIRVLALVETDKTVNHVYLKGAENLRKDLTAHYNIAIDGPAGSGKSTIAKILGKNFNILCLDTGAMYRACALKCIKENVCIDSESSVPEIMRKLDLSIKYENGRQITLLDGIDVSEEIRKPEVSMIASKVSAFQCVRDKMVEMQRKIASQTSCVLDGRDIGSNVLPNADFKFFLTATPEVRAKRRALENAAKGFNSSFENILQEIKLRDDQDSKRKIAPLVCAKDAIVIDTSEMTIDEVVSLIEKKIQGKI